MGLEQFPWQQDAESHFIVMRTNEGVYELRPYDTFIFEPEDVALNGLRHVFHITEDNEESEKYEGIYIWKEHMERVGFSYDRFVQELIDHDFETMTFDEPHPDDLKAYERAHDRPFVAETPEDRHEEIVRKAMRVFDAAWVYYSLEWGDGSQG